MNLQRGSSYRRTELHDHFGGQQQSGIVTPRNHPLLLLFSTPNGERFGYVDGWVEDRLYRYTGEGQVGDMDLKRGNSALLNHRQNGEELHLFESETEGLVVYVGRMQYVRHNWTTGPDREGNTRNVVLFYLERA